VEYLYLLKTIDLEVQYNYTKNRHSFEHPQQRAGTPLSDNKTQLPLAASFDTFDLKKSPPLWILLTLDTPSSNQIVKISQ
jgi:hypothetical protein